MTAPTTTTRIVEKVSGALARRFSRRGFFARSAVVGSALAVDPVAYALRPATAYAAVCNCSGSACDCGALCCDGYTEFCCTLTGENKCPPGTYLGGWWKADGTAYCSGPRYYMDCNAPCNGCGCGGNGICSGACSGTGCGCAGGDCNNRKSGCTQFRYGQCNQAVPCIGPILCRLVTCVPPWAISETCSTTSRTDQATATHNRPCLHKVVGALDSVAEVSGGVRVTGWALDFDTSGPTSVHVYLDGKMVGATTADRSRPDIAAAYPGWGPAHGFDFTFPAGGTGHHNVCVYGIDVGASSGSNPLLGCKSITYNNPFGSLDDVRLEPGLVRVSGWVIDPNVAGPVTVHVYADGAFQTAVLANQDRPDVSAAFPGYGPAHGFDAAIPLGQGTHEICVYGINQGAGTANPQIGCRTVQVGRPFGWLDVARPAFEGIEVSGWVIDPDTAGATSVQVRVDGALAATLPADQDRPDVGAAYPTYGPAHGFAGTVPASPGSHQVCVYAVNVGGGVNPLLACRTVSVPTGNPFGALDVALAGPDVIRVAGWVLDPDVTAPVEVHVYLDGQFAMAGDANQDRPDVAAAYPGFGTTHGFQLDVPADHGWREVCVYAINQGPGTVNPLVGCRNVFVGGAPYGALDVVRPASGSIRVAGWVIDPDSALPAQVHVYVDGQFAAVADADQDRPDVGAAFPLYGSAHGFDMTIGVSPGRHSVCVYGIDRSGGDANPLLGCRDATVS